MAKSGLLRAACTVALLAAAPAFAQTATQPADTGAGNMPNAPAAHDSSGMSPGMKMGSSTDGESSGTMSHQSTHRSAMGGGHESMHSRNDTSQNAAVERLNDQSFQAAQSGQAYTGSGTMGSGGMGGSMGAGSPGVMSGATGDGSGSGK
jgi:hypothetical protein